MFDWFTYADCYMQLNITCYLLYHFIRCIVQEEKLWFQSDLSNPLVQSYDQARNDDNDDDDDESAEKEEDHIILLIHEFKLYYKLFGASDSACVLTLCAL